MNTLIRVSAAILIEDDKILIAQRGPQNVLAGLWEFPGGKIEPEETPQQCLVREIREELGLHIEVGKLFGKNIHAYDHISIELWAFQAKLINGRIVLNEHADCRWVNIDELSRFNFSKADLPFVKMIIDGALDL